MENAGLMSFSQNSCQKVQFSTGTAEPITADIGILKFELECIYIYMQCIVESFPWCSNLRMVKLDSWLDNWERKTQFWGLFHRSSAQPPEPPFRPAGQGDRMQALGTRLDIRVVLSHDNSATSIKIKRYRVLTNRRHFLSPADIL